MARTPTFRSLREAAEAGYHGKAVNIEGKGLQKVAFADEAYDRRMAERSARANESDSSVGSIRPQPRPSRAPEESPRPTSRSNRSMGTFREDGTVEGEGQRARPGSRSTPTRTQAPERSMGRFSERGTVEGEGQRARPGALQRAIDSAPNAAARSRAERIEEQYRAGRMPLREAINKINELFSNFTSPMAGRNEEMRQRRAAAGMARGGMVKKGNTDRRGKGMFYDSKSPRGYK